jgi:hypothetical protein
VIHPARKGWARLVSPASILLGNNSKVYVCFHAEFGYDLGKQNLKNRRCNFNGTFCVRRWYLAGLVDHIVPLCPDVRNLFPKCLITTWSFKRREVHSSHLFQNSEQDFLEAVVVLIGPAQDAGYQNPHSGNATTQELPGQTIEW